MVRLEFTGKIGKSSCHTEFYFSNFILPYINNRSR